MAAGEIFWFDQALLDLGEKIHDLSSDVLQLGIIKSLANSGFDPALTTPDPRWGAGGGTNLLSSQVVTTGSSYTGPKTLTTVTWTIVSGVPTLRADVVALAQDASGFTNGRWGILFNNTAAGKQALGWCDLGADKSLVTGGYTFDWAGATNDILTINQS